MGMRSPTHPQTKRGGAPRQPVSELAVTLWTLAILIAVYLLTCWIFERMHAP
jgi:hypothetical protein